MKKVLALSAVAVLVLAAPAYAGGHRNHGNDHGSTYNAGHGNGSVVGDISVLDGSYFLNGVYIGNDSSILSGILSGNNVLSGLGLNVLSGNNNDNSRKSGGGRRGHRW